MSDRLQAYLQRIGYQGVVRPDFQTLVGLHRAHLLTIPYENLDIHRGKTLSVDEDAIFDKIVRDGRGGWCYEMNGLFAWALKEIGFDVTLMGSTVNRQPTGRTIEGNHLVLLVQLERPYLVDVGFGNGFLEPLPLEEGVYQRGYLDYELWKDGDRWWFKNQRFAPIGYDFTLDAHQLGDFAPQSHELQTWEESGFVRTTVCQRFTPAGFVMLRGAVLTTVTENGAEQGTIADAAEYREALENLFDLHLPDAEILWEKVWARHQDWLKAQPSG
jgi:N-hydroxyarylamine O-acetyltransferase